MACAPFTFWKKFQPTPEQIKSVPVLTTTNVVSTYCLRSRHIDLTELARAIPALSFNSMNFAAGTIRLTYPHATSLIFADGRGVCTGCKSKEESRLACRKFASIMESFGYDVTFSDFHVQNLVSNVSCNFNIDLYGIAQMYPSKVSYEPEKFPGLRCRITRTENLSESEDEDDEDVTDAQKLLASVIRKHNHYVIDEVNEEEEDEEEEEEVLNAISTVDHERILANYAVHRKRLDPAARSSLRDKGPKNACEGRQGSRHVLGRRRGKIVFIVFHSGNCIVTGAKSHKQAMKAWIWFYLELVSKFKENAVPVFNAAQYRLRESRQRGGDASLSVGFDRSVHVSLENHLLAGTGIISLLIEERQMRAALLQVTRTRTEKEDEIMTDDIDGRLKFVPTLDEHLTKIALNPIHVVKFDPHLHRIQEDQEWGESMSLFEQITIED